MADTFFHAALFFAEFGFLGPFIIFGIYCIDKRIFLNALIMCIVSAFVNAYLKSIWQIPLDPSLGKIGWAFPSGHTQFNLVVWLVLLYQIRKLWLMLAAGIVTVSSYFGMIHFHYHDWYDIYGGIFFGILLFLAFAVWDHFFKNKQFELSMMGLVVSVLILSILPPPPGPGGPGWLVLYLGMSTGVVLYLLIERLGHAELVSKLNSRRFGELLLVFLFMYVVKSINTEQMLLIYLKGLALTAVSLGVVSRSKIQA